MKSIRSAAGSQRPATGKIPESYTDLCQAWWLPRPIHSENEFRAAVAVVELLAGFGLNQDQEDYLEAVAHFVDEYDRKSRPQLPRATGVEVLRELLDARDLGGADLSRILRVSRNVGAMILRGERSLTLDHVRRLADEFKVAPGVLV